MALRRLLPALLLLGACAADGSGLPPLPAEDGAAYRLGPQDVVRVAVFNDPRLAAEFRVSDTGAIVLPLLGAIPAGGRTTAEVTDAIAGAMQARNLFAHPDVAVEVLGYRPVHVLGMVERAGQFPYQPGMTVLTAVAVAGGYNYRAVREQVGVTRTGPDGRPREYRAARLTRLEPGDIVTVFERRF